MARAAGRRKPNRRRREGRLGRCALARWHACGPELGSTATEAVAEPIETGVGVAEARNGCGSGSGAGTTLEGARV